MTAQSARSRSAIAGPHPPRVSLLAQSSTETFWCWTHRSELQRLWPCLDVRHFVPNKVHRHRRIGPSGPSRRSHAVLLPSGVEQRSVWRGHGTPWIHVCRSWRKIPPRTDSGRPAFVLRSIFRPRLFNCFCVPSPPTRARVVANLLYARRPARSVGRSADEGRASDAQKHSKT